MVHGTLKRLLIFCLVRVQSAVHAGAELQKSLLKTNFSDPGYFPKPMRHAPFTWTSVNFMTAEHSTFPKNMFCHDRYNERLQPFTDQTVLSATQIWVWWTPGDPSLNQRMKKLLDVWMIFGSKFLSSFLLSAIFHGSAIS